MVEEVSNVKFKYDGVLQLSEEIVKKSNNCWDKYKKENANAYSEEILIVEDIRKSNDNFEIILKTTGFSNVFFSKNTNKLKISPLFSGAYIVTSDNYIGIVLNNEYTLGKDNMLNLIGGMAGVKDIINSEYKSEECIKREFKEEIGLDLDTDQFNYELKYLKYRSNIEENICCYPVGTIYEIKTIYTKNELTNLFNKAEHDIEVKEIVFFSKENYKDILNYKFRKKYLIELWHFLFE